MGRTALLYEEDAYVKEFSAKVIDCIALNSPDKEAGFFAVELDQTAFFPEGGGQSCDGGFLNDEPVHEVYKQDGRVWHVLKKSFAKGEIVCGVLDFGTRFHKMQNHSGEHIISGLIASLYGYENVGFHMSEDVMTVDIQGALEKEAIEKIELLANEAVWQNKKIDIVYPDRPDDMEYRSKLELEEEIRVVVIDGIDACACCAPHVRSTGEIGLIKIIDFMKYKGGTRLFVKCGHWAYLSLKNVFDQNTEIMKLLSAKREGCLDAVLKCMETIQKKKEEEMLLKKQIVGLYLEKLQSEELFFADHLDDMQLRQIVNESITRGKDVVAGFVGNDANGYRYIIGKNEKKQDLDLRKLAQDMKEGLKGRGGGSDKMIQGSVMTSQKEIQAFWEREF